MSGNWIVPLLKTRTVPELGVRLRSTTTNSVADKAHGRAEAGER